ncbi:acyl-CoA dehydratase activase [Eggerthella sinensis]|jgi:(R)-2-hydroxyacyl-CoA dehydratese activating ATPase|uniref:acyl-CoA dehydratase activase n=1 Tax=Eggerthella sinensis TaxID=242230 RepID=UPI001D06EA32|nr:acyl-CoA dehydratase activase [Eggerthella sinensis]MCB7037756.1 acyl-CoA dehydratase activase [Eggerthella sinensis]
MGTRWYLGIDVGSTASKCVIVDECGEVAGTGLHPSGAGTAGPQKALAAAFDALGDGSTMATMAAVCSTGYGRHLLADADEQLSELSCHAKGAARLFPGVRTIVDIGGQDAKVLRVDERGRLENFVMNDKCAAGTGRFLDVMASIFGCTVADLSAYDARAEKVSPVSSTCTVFAESEVISKLSQGESIPNIVAGIHLSVVERTHGLMRRVGVEPGVAMTGGVALNEGLRRRLAALAGYDIVTSPLAQYNGALGAALYALEKASAA